MNAMEYQHLVALAYDQAPLKSGPSVRAWELLADRTMDTFATVKHMVDVRPVALAEPYPSHRAMFDAIAGGILLVSDVNHNHPVWSPEVNRAFRAVHDVMGHYGAQADFSWEGELKAWEAHDRWVIDPGACAALFTEAVGQVAWMLSPDHGKGTFGPQKVALLPQWLQWVTCETVGVAA